jgi:RNA polymerase sigma-70 factor (ECF subfamily)
VSLGDLANHELVSALRRGDPAAFDELYRRHHARVWAFLMRLTGRLSDAEDLFQETWLAAARHAKRLAPDSDPLPWLYTIARNQHRSARRFVLFDTRKRELFAFEPIAPPQLPDEHADARARGRALAEAFDDLPEAHREVLLLCLVEGLDTRQVAAILDLREDAVRKRLSRARAELASRLEARQTGEGSPNVPPLAPPLARPHEGEPS